MTQYWGWDGEKEEERCFPESGQLCQCVTDLEMTGGHGLSISYIPFFLPIYLQSQVMTRRRMTDGVWCAIGVRSKKKVIASIPILGGGILYYYTTTTITTIPKTQPFPSRYHDLNVFLSFRRPVIPPTSGHLSRKGRLPSFFPCHPLQKG